MAKQPGAHAVHRSGVQDPHQMALRPPGEHLGRREDDWADSVVCNDATTVAATRRLRSGSTY